MRRMARPRHLGLPFQSTYSVTSFLIVCFYSISQSTKSGNALRLCERIHFNHGDENKMPYVQLGGVYRKLSDVNGYPLFKHEQRNYYFEYVKSENVMAFSTEGSGSRRAYIGVKATMTSEFASSRWTDKITDAVYPFKKFVVQWEYYDWQASSHVSGDTNEVGLVCIPDDFFRCASRNVFFNTTFTRPSDGVVLHNHLTDYFQEMIGGYSDYRNKRKKYRHNRQRNWVLYHEVGYWKVRDDGKVGNTAFLRAKDSSFRPEYITAPWENLRGVVWQRFSLPVGIRCRGIVRKDTNGTALSCSEWDPCTNGGRCFNSELTNETVCVCREEYSGTYCHLSTKSCSKYLYPSSVQQVVIWGLEASNVASVFCKKGYEPRYFLSVCQQSKYTTSWVKWGSCTYKKQSTTRRPIRTYPKWVEPGKQSKPFNFDDYYWIRPVLLAIVPLLQIAIPTTHMLIGIHNDKSSLRIISLHAFISFVCWWVYLLGCKATQCQKHGQVLGDFITMSIVMICLSYFYMLIESCFSPESQYISSILTDVSAVDFVNKLKNASVTRTMMIDCYHYETRIRTVYYTDAQGNTQTRTETYQERVSTYEETQYFPIGRTLDASDPEGLQLDRCNVTRLKLTPEVQCGDTETLEKFNEMSDQMVEDNKHRDEHIDFTYDDVIDGFKKRICAYTDPKQRPFWMNVGSFWLANIFGLTWLFRAMFHWKSKKCEYTVKKLIFLRAEGDLQVGDAREAIGLQIVYRPDGADYVNHYGVDNLARSDTPGTGSNMQPGQEFPMQPQGMPYGAPPAYDVVFQSENRVFENSST